MKIYLDQLPSRLMPDEGQWGFVTSRRRRPGPIFRQRRFALDGREIGMLKFRTMRVMEDRHTTYTQVTREDTNKVFTDVDVVCNVHVPEWMRKAFSLRSDSIDVGLAPGMRRWSRITKGAARAVRSAVRRPLPRTWSA